ncbi:tyrosine phosphatase II superfamily protein [Legionella birminghamensis]|uniref:Tyrosine phosphatase II superfamily protein n=2 Tax=Legionella birminghamensis TaxID=28083 RepID=A0A378IE69_9GAMM|nr:hypothetical protein [Legionella birminghamensis]KTC68888.1 tyrosine phosphatase II superfamily protein [Legionella birminghamensis]STX33170.1 tyrosine phosphatase II superfamily protein [Legionella birminghamensis]
MPDSTSLGSMRDLSQIIPLRNKDSFELWVSASANPNLKGWLELADFIDLKSSFMANPRIVLDLRQENHAYLNGNSITLCDTHNWINLGKSTEQAEQAERDWLLTLGSAAEISGILTPEQFVEKNYSSGTTVQVESLNNEKQIVSNLGFTYYRMAVSDHQAPGDKIVDEFVNFINHLPPQAWLHIHCRGGKGRSTTFIVMYDMLKNAQDFSFEEIIARHAAVPPYYDLANTSRSDSELTHFFEERYQFLQRFYRYAQDYLQGYSGSWTEWKAFETERCSS